MIYNIIGLMSGTSLDGTDLAYCQLKYEKDTWSYKIIAAKTYSYSKNWKLRLKQVENSSAIDFITTDTNLGIYFGNKINEFISDFKINRKEIDAIASHGHTIFHQPHLGFSTQIGNGAQICAISKLKTIVDFRSIDVALNGQGAPLVPIGDLLLFNDYNNCLNLGGIANISFQKEGKRVAKDITFANMIGNHLCEEVDLEFDDKGTIASNGNIDNNLFNLLNEVTESKNLKNKSLGKEIFTIKILPYLQKSTNSLADNLHTLAHHIATKVSENTIPNSSLLITGGGAYNDFWIKLIKERTQTNITIPSDQIIEFKEALIFAFLGALRLNKSPNSLASVTSAKKDSIGGAIYLY